MRRRNLLIILMGFLFIILATLVVLVVYLMRAPDTEEEDPKLRPTLVLADKIDPYVGKTKTGSWSQYAIALVQKTEVPDPESIKKLIAYRAQRAEADAWLKRKDLKSIAKKLKTFKKDKQFKEALQWVDGSDPGEPSAATTSIKALVDRGYLESELNMSFLKIRVDQNKKILWRAQHLDLDRPNPNSNKADPYFEVSLEYFDEGVSFGPVWVVNVETNEVVPRNGYAKIFERSASKKNGVGQIAQLNQNLVLVVKALTNTQLANGLQLGSFLLQNFVRSRKQCFADQAQATDSSAFACENDRIVGWTVDHLLEGEYIAYFQWVENGDLRIARWDVTLEEAKEKTKKNALPTISFVPRGLQAIELMQLAETFCPGEVVAGKKADETEVDLCRETFELSSCPNDLSSESGCNAADDGYCCESKESDGQIEVVVDPNSPDALARFNGLRKALLAGEDPDAVVGKVANASQSDLIAVFGARNGPLWPKIFDPSSNSWRADWWYLTDNKLKGAISKNEGLKPRFASVYSQLNAFESVLREGDFVSASQQLLSSQDGSTIAPDACDLIEEAFKKRIIAEGKGAEDEDGDGLPNNSDNCIQVPNKNQAQGFAVERRVDAYLAEKSLPTDDAEERANAKAAVVAALSGRDLAGDACACRWARATEPFAEGEGLDGALRTTARIVYRYRDGDVSEELGFLVVSAPYYYEDEVKAAEEKRIIKWALRNREKIHATDQELLASFDAEPQRDVLDDRYIIPVGDLSEWAYWSVNPRNLKGRQTKAWKLLPEAARDPKAAARAAAAAKEEAELAAKKEAAAKKAAEEKKEAAVNPETVPEDAPAPEETPEGDGGGAAEKDADASK